MLTCRQWKAEILSQLGRDRIAAQLAPKPAAKQDLNDALARDISALTHKHRMLEASIRSDIDGINQGLATVRSNMLRMEGDVANATAESTLALRTANQAQRTADHVVDSFKAEARHLTAKLVSKDDLDEQALQLRFVARNCTVPISGIVQEGDCAA